MYLYIYNSSSHAIEIGVSIHTHTPGNPILYYVYHTTVATVAATAAAAAPGYHLATHIIIVVVVVEPGELENHFPIIVNVSFFFGNLHFSLFTIYIHTGHGNVVVVASARVKCKKKNMFAFTHPGGRSRSTR